MPREISTAALARTTPVLEETQSAVSWSAVFAGAAAALALAIVLSGLAAGFGAKLATPWLASRGSLAAFTPLLGATAIVVQVLSAGLGGYLAGRLRAQWLNVHRHEVHFRDTAHGLIVWAVSTLAGVLLAASVLGPYAERLAAPVIVAAAPAQTAAVDTAVDAEREASITAQSAFFLSFGLLLSAFTASVAAALGGIRRDEMYAQP
jgi:hypothetical protein